MTRTARVVTASNRAAAGVYEDKTGPVIVGWLRERGYDVPPAAVVPDGEPVAAALRSAVAEGVDVVVTTGGTGVTPTDRTPEATRAVLDYEIPGIADAIRAAGLPAVPTAVLSRGLAGVAGHTLVVNLPGSSGGVKDGLRVLDGVLNHALDQLHGGDHPRPPADQPTGQPAAAQHAAGQTAASQHAASHHTATQHASGPTADSPHASPHTTGSTAASQHATGQHTASQHAASHHTATQHAATQHPAGQTADSLLAAATAASQHAAGPTADSQPAGQHPTAGHDTSQQPATQRPETQQSVAVRAEVLRAEVTDTPIDVESHAALVENVAAGAVVTFAGVVRDHDHGRGVTALDYEGHPTAAEVIAEVAAEVAARHSGVRALAVSHRIGSLAIGDTALACAVSADHRRAAFTACADLVDEVKSRLPIWKHQRFTDGTDEWVNCP